VASIYRLQERIAGMRLDDAVLDRIEHEVIDECGLSPDHKAELRQFAWSFMNGDDGRLQDLRVVLRSH
jgi:hypothetical protein